MNVQGEAWLVTLVGLALDTGELTAGGIDPVDVIGRYGDRVWHVQFKDALAVDDDRLTGC